MTSIPVPLAVAEEFLACLEDERRETVGELFTDDAVITVPGARFEGEAAADEFLAHYGPRYEWAAKVFDRWIEAGTEVVTIGTLYGVDNDGNPFSDVRYVDVYTIEDGVIARLDIWNDLVVDGI